MFLWRKILFAGLLAGLGAAFAAPSAAEEKNAEKPDGKTRAKTARAAAKDKKPAPGAVFLREAAAKLDGFTFGKAEIAKTEAFIKQAKKPEDKIPFASLLCRYRRDYLNKPDEAAEAVLPFLLDKEKITAWTKANAVFQKSVAKEAQEAKANKKTADAGKDAAANQNPETARAPAPARMAPLPPANEWQISAVTAPAAVELAGCLAAAGQVPEALAVINRVGTDFADANRVLAAELAGDLFLRNAQPQRAIEMYEYGIKYVSGALGTTTRDDKGNYGKEYSEYERALRARLERKLAKARAAAEAEKYGPDWVLYRDAESARRERGDFLRAYLLYEKLVAEYPETVYAEAGKCYRIKTLLDLADKHHAEKIQKTLKEQDKAIADVTRLLQNAKAAKVCKQTFAALQARLDAARARKERLLAVPTGEKAEKAANAEAKKFLAENEFGLYRGEVILMFANYLLEKELDPQAARPEYDRVIAWVEKAKTVDGELAKFAVPGKSATVTLPPKEMREHVYVVLNNAKTEPWRKIHPGQLFNRRECGWYLDFLMTDALSKKSFCQFLAGDKEEAVATAEKIKEYDKAEYEQEQKGQPNYLRRLPKDYRRGYLFTKPEYLKDFKGKRRLRLLLADLYCEMDRDSEGCAIVARMLAEKQENPPATAYLHFMHAVLALSIDFDTEKAVVEFQQAAVNKKFPIYVDAMQRSWYYGQYGKGGYRYALEIMRKIYDDPEMPKEKRAEYLLDAADLLHVNAQFDEARDLLERYIKKYPNSDLMATVELTLEQVKKHILPGCTEPYTE